jgi:signal transduction histidine kinase
MKISINKEYIVHAIIWISGFIIFAAFAQNVGNAKRETVGFVSSIALGTIFNIILFYTVSFRLIGRYNQLRSNAYLFASIILALIGITAIESIIDYLLFPAYYSSEKEPLYSQFIVTLTFNLFILGIALGYGFIKKWLQSERQKQELKSQKLSAELDFLKAQVNPHVLFNMLNMAFSSATTNGDERTAYIIEKISSQLRYVLYDSNINKVSLIKETDHIEGFVALQKMRISADMPLKISLEISVDDNNYTIPPLLLVPFIENAFKYGISFNTSSEIKIAISCKNGILNLHVSNPIVNNQREGVVGESSGIGLKNVKKRLSILYPSSHVLEIFNDGKTFIVNLTIQL